MLLSKSWLNQNLLMDKHRTFGIVGRNITHSFSPDYFNNKFLKEIIDARYLIFDIQSLNDLNTIINSNPTLTGFNLTIPYKSTIMELLQETDSVARKIGAVNTVAVNKSGLKGYNTDWIGFEKSLLPLIKNRNNLSALILGTGGASKAVAYVLKKLSIPFRYVSRTKSDNTIIYEDVDEAVIKSSTIIINTTPLGMYPNLNTAPNIPYKHISKRHILYDLIYNPGETLFLQKGRSVGATTKNGLEMLYIQAEASWEIWNK